MPAKLPVCRVHIQAPSLIIDVCAVRVIFHGSGNIYFIYFRRGVIETITLQTNAAFISENIPAPYTENIYHKFAIQINVCRV